MEFSKDHLPADPIALFDQWYRDAQANDKIIHADAFCLSTVNQDNFPEARMLLLKKFSHNGFVFFSNTQSAKGASLEINPHAAMTFYWQQLERQVRIQGSVKYVSTTEADAYFASRPRRSQLGAWSSKQSAAMDRPSNLEERMMFFENYFFGRDVPRPPFWHGYILKPVAIEFWQGKNFRLHDRYKYTRTDDTSWCIQQLYP